MSKNEIQKTFFKKCRRRGKSAGAETASMAPPFLRLVYYWRI